MMHTAQVQSIILHHWKLQAVANCSLVSVWLQNFKFASPKLYIPAVYTCTKYTASGFFWCDRPFYLVKWLQEKWACDFHDDAKALSFQLQVTEDFF